MTNEEGARGDQTPDPTTSGVSADPMLPLTDRERLIAAYWYWAGWERAEEAQDDAYQQGWYAHARHEAASTPPPKVTHFGRWYDQAIEREKHDANRHNTAEAA